MNYNLYSTDCTSCANDLVTKCWLQADNFLAILPFVIYNNPLIGYNMKRIPKPRNNDKTLINRKLGSPLEK